MAGIRLRVVMHPEGYKTPAPAHRLDPPPGDRRVRVGLVGPSAHVGGAEDWQATLARALEPERVALQGIAILDTNHGDAGMRDELGRACGAMFEGFEGARKLAARCDLVVSWGIREDLLLDFHPEPPVHVAVAHCQAENPWATDLWTHSTGIDHFVAVHDLALPTIPEKHRRRSRVIWNAVDPERLVPKRDRAEMHAAWGVPDGAKVLGFLGRFDTWQKSPRAMAEAVDHLPEPWHVVMVGSGADRPWVLDLAGDRPRLHAPGPDRDAGSVLGAFDALCVPSTSESFGLSIAEGLWAGVPTLATEVGILKGRMELVRALPNPATGEAIAAALHADLADPEGTRARVARAVGWSRAWLSLDRFGREWTDHLAALSVRPGSRPACSFRESCGCQMPRCLHPGAATKFGTGPERRVTSAACRQCGGA